MVVPVMYSASSEARNSTALATSRGVPRRPSGTISRIERMKAGGADLWTASPELRQQLFSAKYSDPTFESWYKRATQVGFDGKAYIEKIKATLGR